MEKTIQRIFAGNADYDLETLLPVIPDMDKHKCRVIYDEDGIEVEFVKYQTPQIHSLKLIEDSAINYEFKSVDRLDLSRLYNQRGLHDDIIIIKNGKMTDSYFANLALYDGDKWYTPNTPLLKGVKREQLLEEGKLIEMEVTKDSLKSFEKISLINAMNDLGDLTVKMNQVR